MKPILVPISPGELIDKLTILEIKCARITDPDRRANVAHERELLEAALAEALSGAPPDARITALRAELVEINTALWEIEDEIRAHEARRDFAEGFVALARAVYRTNDRRAAVKRRINARLGSELVEEKSYVDPDVAHGGANEG
ncbi:DUF6165 family protein [Limimaricola litoreus]|uniref:DUF6165 family protein n=1 Tax=Limimaricola litoreus TaxID=2955316 RepID=A0A9X2FMR0_9RHOB|nr:DUF6165 family protein [Limimaricola litoreus]MCP1167629.1 DUF6165 family protein [Limimaricola litoreus]